MHTETHERRAAVYARYSSDMQNPATIESQVHECQTYAERHSIGVLQDHVYADEARSGSSTLHRSALHQMLSTVRSKACPFNVLLVWKFSRLCRSMKDSLVIRAELERAGVELVSVSEPMPQDQALGKLLRNILAAMDAFFIERIASESRRGQVNLLRQGFAAGRCPYGYYDDRVANAAGRLNRKGEIILHRQRHISPLEAEAVRQAFTLFVSGLGTPRIARTLKSEGTTGPGGRPWTASVVGRVLRNPIYGGQVIFHSTFPATGADGRRKRLKRPSDEWSAFPAEHLRIVDPAIFEAAQARHREFQEMTFARRHKCRRYLLSGLLRCGHCGRICTTRSDARTGEKAYCCQTYHFYGREECPNGRRVGKELLDSLVWRQIVGIFLAGEFRHDLKERIRGLWEAEAGRHDQEDHLRLRIERLGAEIRRLTSAVAQAPDVEPLVDLLRSKASEQKALEARSQAKICYQKRPKLREAQLDALLADLPRVAEQVNLLPTLQKVLERAVHSLCLRDDGSVRLQLLDGKPAFLRLFGESPQCHQAAPAGEVSSRN